MAACFRLLANSFFTDFRNDEWNISGTTHVSKVVTVFTTKAYWGEHYSSIHSDILGIGRGVWSASPRPGRFNPPPTLPTKEPPGPNTGMVALNCWCTWCNMKFVQRTQNASVFWCCGDAISCDRWNDFQSPRLEFVLNVEAVCFPKRWYRVSDCILS
jgi:hypothetical protein